MQTPYHRGEEIAQESVGQVHAARRLGKVITDRIPSGALAFVGQQRVVVLASLDSDGDPWASVLQGPAGFALAATPALVELDLTAAAGRSEDPLWENLESDPRLGLLFIDLATRRRLRVNGRARLSPGRKLSLAVEEAYPNCPKYIQRRHAKPNEPGGRSADSPARHGEILEGRQRRWIHAADTFFVASAHPEGGADASHRGGNPGFVELVDERTLRIPDYVGNNMFNTLGNFVVHPRAGLLFLDLERHRVLQLSGRTELHWHLDEPAERTGGTQRYWTFETGRWIESDLPAMYRWKLLDPSPFNPGGGKK